MNHASFRDPAGILHRTEGRILRCVRPEGRGNAEAYLQSPALQGLKARGRLISGAPLPAGEVPEALHPADGDLWLEHPRIPFPTFPQEWTWSMLRDAALLTLDIALEILPEGLELKDATPWNILFQGTGPIFVDALSFEPRPADRPYWKAYGQFLSTFLCPLVARRNHGLPLTRSFVDRSGLSLAECYNLAGFFERLSPFFLTKISLPHWLSRSSLRPRLGHLDPKIIEELIARRLRSLRATLASWPAPRDKSAWTSYTGALPYSAEDFQAKTAFAARVVRALPPVSSVLDLGANTGEFSFLAAEEGHRVLAVEQDPECADRLYHEAGNRKLPILPVVLNWAAPAHGSGWEGRETPDFNARSQGQFDLVLALAFQHHIRFSQGIPLDRQIVQLAGHCRGQLLLEWVGPEDPMVRKLVEDHGFLPEDYSQARLESLLSARFRVIERLPLPGGTRCLYWLDSI